MALVNCPECNKEISDTAASCPGCGAPVETKPAQPRAPRAPQKKKPGGCAVTFAAVFIGFIVLFIIGMMLTDHTKTTNTPTFETSGPEARLRHNRAVLVGNYIKKTLRDPDSIKWEKLLANKNATVLCLKYQAKNRLGILVREYTVFVNGKPKPGAGSWNQHCVNNEMFNMALAKYDMN